MSADIPSTPHPPGATTGTDERPPQRLADTVLTFDLAREVAQLRAERAWHAGDRNAKTLVKAAGCTMVLIVLRSGGRMAEHRAGGGSASRRSRATCACACPARPWICPRGGSRAWRARCPTRSRR